ncbi:hypothetical protein ACFWTE_11430 [Nocardiopsis sp. NPDC058631]|uniref:hypothetical protein n=1 Tax=Nocardiopsis sp. NPDC058631 TaxID=3346566 RepID=UPI003657233D
MTAVLMLAAAALLCTTTAVLLAATGRDLIHTEHPLPVPERRARRTPKEDTR